MCSAWPPITMNSTPWRISKSRTFSNPFGSDASGMLSQLFGLPPGLVGPADPLFDRQAQVAADQRQINSVGVLLRKCWLGDGPGQDLFQVIQRLVARMLVVHISQRK